MRQACDNYIKISEITFSDPYWALYEAKSGALSPPNRLGMHLCMQYSETWSASTP